MDWTTGVPAIAAGVTSLGVVGAAFRYAGSLRDRQRDQASRVFAWYQGKLGGGVDVTVQNLSDRPVFEIVAEEPTKPIVMHLIGMLLPSSATTVEAVDGVPLPLVPTPLGLWFTDGAGRRWFRSGSGKLYRWHWLGHRRYRWAQGAEDRYVRRDPRRERMKDGVEQVRRRIPMRGRE